MRRKNFSPTRLRKLSMTGLAASPPPCSAVRFNGGTAGRCCCPAVTEEAADPLDAAVFGAWLSRNGWLPALPLLFTEAESAVDAASSHGPDVLLVVAAACCCVALGEEEAEEALEEGAAGVRVVMDSGKPHSLATTRAAGRTF